MKPTALAASIINVIANTLLFGIKLWVALLSGSIALLSDAFNSLTDIASSIAVFICVRISGKQADEGHPFGHSRAEPVAGLIVAILAGILGFEVIKISVERLFSEEALVVVGTAALLVPVITIVTKLCMATYFKRVGKELHSPAITASATDSMMDVAVSVAALVGIIGVKFGYPVLDPVAGLVISVWIIYTGYSIGMENIDYLMGKAPESELMEELKGAALSVPGVEAINTVRAHYVGPFIHVEIHVEVPRHLSTYDSHEIGEEATRKVEEIGAIEKCFVHIDPV